MVSPNSTRSPLLSAICTPFWPFSEDIREKQEEINEKFDELKEDFSELEEMNQEQQSPTDLGDLGASCDDAIAPASGYDCVCSAGDREQSGTCVPSDECPADPNKTEPGVCGCGVPEQDHNGDGITDCETIVFSDNFESGLGKWNVDSPWRTTSPEELQVPNHPSSNRVANAAACFDCGIDSPTFDTSGALEVTVTLYRYIDEAIDSDQNEYLDLWVHSRDQWHLVKSWFAPRHDDDTWHFERFDITQHAASDMKIGLYAKSSETYEELEVDDVTVTMIR